MVQKYEEPVYHDNLQVSQLFKENSNKTIEILFKISG